MNKPTAAPPRPATPQQAAKHTPTPWTCQLGDNKFMDKFGQNIIKSGDEWVALVCDFNRHGRDAERDANATLVIRAVNSHAALVVALRTMLAHADDACGSCLHESHDKARAALALAEGGAR